MATEFSGRGGDRSYSGLVKSFGRVGAPGYIPFAGASEAAPKPGQVHQSMRTKAAKKSEQAGRITRPAPYDAPVTIRRFVPVSSSRFIGPKPAPTPPKKRPAGWRGLSAEHTEAADRSARSTATVMNEEMLDDTPMKRDKSGNLVSRPYTDFDNADDVFEDERTNKERLSDAEYRSSAEKKTGNTRRVVAAQRLARKGVSTATSAQASLDAAARVGGKWAEKGAGIPSLKNQRVRGFKMVTEANAKQTAVFKARSKEAKLKRNALAREAGRQTSVGIRTPAVTGPDVEERKKNVARIQRTRSKPLSAKLKGGGARSVLGAFAEPIAAAGVGAVRAALDPKVSVGDAFDWWKKKYTSDPLKKTYGESRTF